MALGPRSEGDVFGLEPEELAIQVGRWGWPRYRAEQMFRALHQGYAGDWEAVKQLAAGDRAKAAEALPLAWPEIAERYQSSDGTIRYLLRLADGAKVESVYLPVEQFDPADGVGAPVRRRTTFCISTQVGCAVNCQFCLTATLGLTRNLTAGEIVAQVLTLLREHQLSAARGLDRVNLVYMGMGEPFLNYDNVVRSLLVLTRPEGAGLAPRRITVSTSGIVDKIKRWGEVDFPRGRPQGRPGLAISLNASSDEQRQRLMPLNRGQGGLEALLAAARAMELGPREYITFEYVLLAGVNDQIEDADRVAKLLDGIRSKVNLIAWNMGPELPFRSPKPDAVAAFQQRLMSQGLMSYVRRPRGRDIYAACGQLKRSEGVGRSV